MAAAGTNVMHVEASKGIVTWAKENAQSSVLGDMPIRPIVDNSMKFIERKICRGNHYDAIIMNPPFYGRGSNGEIGLMVQETGLVLPCGASGRFKGK